jgi:hypothetical protein
MKTYLEKFLKETLRFAAGCLNTRHNGTIYFGVGDSVGSQYKHGEIVGYPDEDNEVKVACTDNLRSAIKSCFTPESNCSADKSIADSYFLRVKTDLSGSNLPLYVMEIDIQHYSDVCRDLCFEVNMEKCLKLKGVKGVTDQFTFCTEAKPFIKKKGQSTNKKGGNKINRQHYASRFWLSFPTAKHLFSVPIVYNLEHT